MTDLTDFGVDVKEPETDAGGEGAGESGYGQTRSYRLGRCRAIAHTTGNRCRNPAGHGVDGNYCANGSHNAADGPMVSIDAGPRELVRWLGRASARCPALERDGSRCTNSCGAHERMCAMHHDGDFDEVDELEDGELDVDLIREAIQAVEEAQA